MTNATPTGYGPRHRGLIFDGDESKYELWEINFLGFMRLRKLSDTIDPRSDDGFALRTEGQTHRRTDTANKGLL